MCPCMPLALLVHFSYLPMGQSILFEDLLYRPDLVFPVRTYSLHEHPYTDL